ncbi:MAG TPA: hypothetical protein VNX67_03495 [Solirubrobacteraceae bacterium]|jgi:hypothetical protein|nr:hypothetical protein [Solirubrobacteraceae bacterium]
MNIRILIRMVPAALLGMAAAVLVSCGGSGKGLIPSANAGPLQSDFEAVARAAGAGKGSCAQTESALGQTEQDFLKLPATVDKGLHARLQLGIENLRTQALAMCEQPAETSTTGTQTTSTTTTSTGTETTPTTTTNTTTTPTTTPTTPTTTAPPSQSGGTEAREAEESQGEGKGKDNGKGEGEGKGKAEGEGHDGAGVGGASAGGAQ